METPEPSEAPAVKGPSPDEWGDEARLARIGEAGFGVPVPPTPNPDEWAQFQAWKTAQEEGEG